ncbi:LacI family DNA-binding transcriptional regulator [Jiella marina]|uniref:LacI family DNA-binding transcriptional regulator n=1 Tax=Jiella sp. LLJ827 TaxID=2917712 RepID=UPI002100C76C|nr:LacI family DNA-binding transcriptional regulator [Jiella sp. LLJ827]MCQ0989752.1 LacI family DNA-binding transcriptional regulator [Jiella sp. LLJ827]
MHDVAKLAGVSHQTVSRVVNGHPYVKAETRLKVVEAMEALTYVPNASARALAKGRTQTIGVICYETTLYGPAAALIGIEMRARELSHSVNIVSISSLDAAMIKEAFLRLYRQSVAGVALMCPQSAIDFDPKLLDVDLPLVGVWGPRLGTVPIVSIDEIGGAGKATRHLLDRGYDTVHFVGGPAGRVGSNERMKGWSEALKSAGRRVPEPLHGDWSARSGYEAGRILAADRDVSAVFVASDQMALGLLLALGEGGRRVPEDIAVVGFDDVPEAAFFSPPLTTIRQDFFGIGRHVVDALLAPDVQAGTKAVPASSVLPVDLIVRRSSGPA